MNKYFEFKEVVIYNVSIENPELQVINDLAEVSADEPEGDIYFYHSDHLGSSSWITDASGAVNQHLQYLPFGEDYIYQRNTSWNIPYTFSGKEKDSETGYSYFGARYYDSDLSVWLSVDPMSDMYPSTSPFMYVRGNPIILVDPTGMSDERYGLGTRISNWFKGDSWKNKANKFIAKNNLTSKTNSDGSILAHDAESWQRLNETGAESGLNTLDYTFTEDGYSLTTNSSATQSETTQYFAYSSLSTSNSGNVMNWVQGGLDVVGLIPGFGEVADGLNAAIYLARGDKVNAALSAAAMIPFIGWAATITKNSIKLSKAKKALGKVHDIMGGSLPKGKPGKFGSPQRGNSTKGYRLDPGHPNRPPGHPESGPHFNWWDYSKGKRGKGGRSGVEPI